jgi:hypothetical protein
MDWMKIVSALALGLMLVALLPRAKSILSATPKGTPADWQAAILPLLIVMGVVAFLMSSR